MNTLNNARGKWRGILSYLGVPDIALNGKHQPCPVCGQGKDTFRFADNSVGQWFCGYCDPSNNNKLGFDMVKMFLSVDNKQALTLIDEALGTRIEVKEEVKRDPRVSLNRVFKLVRDTDNDTAKYLASRGLKPTSATKSATLDYWEDGKKVGSFNTMICRIVDRDNKPQSYHITYLKDGKKANVKVDKKVMTPVDTITGGAIRLMPFTDTLGIAEGIETALSCYKMFNIPTWATVSANGLEMFDPPKGVKNIVIFSDNDGNYTGQAAAYMGAKRLSKLGINVKVRVSKNEDFNDDLMEKIKHE